MKPKSREKRKKRRRKDRTTSEESVIDKMKGIKSRKENKSDEPQIPSGGFSVPSTVDGG